MRLRNKLIWFVLPAWLLLVFSDLLLTAAYMDSVRIKEIPFGLSEKARQQAGLAVPDIARSGGGIHAATRLEESRGFLHIFNVPYIVCFFAAKGKWPFIPPFMQTRVDATAKTLFSQNDSFIRQFCTKYMQIKECFRPIFGVTTAEPLRAEPLRAATPCVCAASPEPMIFFDRDHIGNVSTDTVRNTIEFLETFLPLPTKKTKKRKNHVRSRLDEIDID